MKDTDLMPWGKYKGTAMANVPSTYLIWLHYNEKCHGAVKEYIEANMEVLKIDVEKSEYEENKSDML